MMVLSSSGLGHHSFKVKTRVRLPLGPNFAGVAQLVEHNLAKVRVASSNLVSRFKFGNSVLEKITIPR